tara:strand:+ start:625 stop:786 length:162 start_codon:yes stop_codon:yes gene_type:complete
MKQYLVTIKVDIEDYEAIGSYMYQYKDDPLNMDLGRFNCDNHIVVDWEEVENE